MYVGGASLAVTAIGHLADRILNDIATPFGGLTTGPAHAALVIAILLLLGDVSRPDLRTGRVRRDGRSVPADPARADDDRPAPHDLPVPEHASA